MKVILQADIPNVGEEGDCVVLSNGYVRNYLLPKKLVMIDNIHNRAVLAGKYKAITKRKLEKQKIASSYKQKLENELFVIEMHVGENGKLFGAITTHMLMQLLLEKGITVERKNIDLPHHAIKTIGEYKITIHLYGSEDAIMHVHIKADNQDDLDKIAERKHKQEEEEKIRERAENEQLKDKESRYMRHHHKNK